MLFQRLFFGALLIAALVLIFWGDLFLASRFQEAGGRGSQCGSVIPLAVVLLSFFATAEAINLTRSAGHAPASKAVVVGVVVLNLTAWAVPAFFAEAEFGPFEAELIVLVLAAMAVSIAQVLRHRTSGGIADIAVGILLLVYLGILPSMITALRAALPGPEGTWAVLLFIAVVKCADIGAYFTGLAVGRTKLIPSISPGKTVEGLAGGVVLAIVVAVVLARWLPWPVGDGGNGPISATQAVLFGAIIAACGQLGDLVESIFKRDAASKDSARLIPSFGGVLDLLDSPAFAAPAAYLLLKTWLAGG